MPGQERVQKEARAQLDLKFGKTSDQDLRASIMAKRSKGEINFTEEEIDFIRREREDLDDKVKYR